MLWILDPKGLYFRFDTVVAIIDNAEADSLVVMVTGHKIVAEYAGQDAGRMRTALLNALTKNHDVIVA